MAIVAVFGQTRLQLLHLFGQGGDLFLLQENGLALRLNLLLQQPLLLSKLDQFFFCCHTLTLTDFWGVGKSLGDLSSYKFRENKK